MNTERDKFLTEALGEFWHEQGYWERSDKKPVSGRRVPWCHICNEEWSFCLGRTNPDFSSLALVRQALGMGAEAGMVA